MAFYDWLTPNLPPIASREEWKEYKRNGGKITSYWEWVREGSPAKDLTPQEKLQARFGFPKPTTPSVPDEDAAAHASYVLSGGSLSIEDWIAGGKPAPTPEDGLQPAVRWETVSQGGWDYQIGYDKNGNIVSQDALGRTELPAGQAPPETAYERALRERAEAETGQIGVPQAPYMYEPWGTSPYDIPETPETEGQFNPYTGQWEQPAGWISPAERERIGLEREVFAWQQQVQQQQTEAEKGRQLAQLRASPSSWLEYASLSGQTPQIQPWMLPLMPQQYAGSQVGGAIPGYQAGGQAMNLPQLVTPSAQFMSRISPSARQQYYGFEAARTGQSPSDVDWRLWSQAPPSGRFGGLRRMR